MLHASHDASSNIIQIVTRGLYKLNITCEFVQLLVFVYVHL